MVLVLKKRVPIYTITCVERMLTTLSSSNSTRCILWLEILVEMTRTFSYKKVTPSLSLGVKIMGSSDWTNNLAGVKTYFLYFLFSLLESPPTEVPPKITLISSKVVAGWSGSFLLCSGRKSFFRNYWKVALSYQSLNFFSRHNSPLYHIPCFYEKDSMF
jgi:hypothetical protein